ncbi:recombination directionality factor [Undibacterium oligocarboniphilum]|uniref:Uncharacterized protein n=1 Tax=Undibacterium oligocarboniphilum TaxID=666702 RepID=A0A850QNN8_9BURK|nr:hypothetical protein [Undibacterium oligocarboniphilum]MBC3871431.1 hypothetical protein [Undibacterium oligocarboniphilum]NVO78993.1 hypothetical protein [Undibacterium oligocarboniphilum]
MTVSNRPVPRSIVDELQLTMQVVGRIRLGKKVLTKELAGNQRAVHIYDQGLKDGLSYDQIEQLLVKETSKKNPLKMENTQHFTFSQKDFHDPNALHELNRMYGEDRGNGRLVYSIPIRFTSDDPLSVMPHRFAMYSTKGVIYFSEYSNEGTRHCMRYPTPPTSATATRITRSFGPRPKEFRMDDDIPDGICNFENCPQFQAKQCRLDLSLQFSIPGIRGAGVIQANTSSTNSLKQWHKTLSFVSHLQGTLRNTEFTLTKICMEVPYFSERGLEKSKQWVTVLVSDIDTCKALEEYWLNQQLDSSDVVHKAVALLENVPGESESDSSQPATAASDVELDERHEMLMQFLASLKAANLTPLERAVKELRAYLKYFGESPAVFNQYAIHKHGDNWASEQKIVEKEILHISTLTVSELQHLLSPFK